MEYFFYINNFRESFGFCVMLQNIDEDNNFWNGRGKILTSSEQKNIVNLYIEVLNIFFEKIKFIQYANLNIDNNYVVQFINHCLTCKIDDKYLENIDKEKFKNILIKILKYNIKINFLNFRKSKNLDMMKKVALEGRSGYDKFNIAG